MGIFLVASAGVFALGGFMKKRPIVLLVSCLLIIFTLLMVFNTTFRATVFITAVVIYTDLTRPSDPASRRIRDGSSGWDETTPLTPDPFAKGVSEGDVLSELKKAKYKPDPDKSFSWRKPKTFPADSQFYKKTVEGLPCSVRYEVVVRFDAQHRLLEAWGTYDEAGCL